MKRRVAIAAAAVAATAGSVVVAQGAQAQDITTPGPVCISISTDAPQNATVRRTNADTSPLECEAPLFP